MSSPYYPCATTNFCCPGPTGPAGRTGSTGPTGPTGPAGPIGRAGLPGTAGYSGRKGERGLRGPTGSTGPTGPKGDAGATGATGSKGPTGPTGPQCTGPTGPTGPSGANALGIKGEKGEPGALRSKLFMSAIAIPSDMESPGNLKNLNVSLSNPHISIFPWIQNNIIQIPVSGVYYISWIVPFNVIEDGEVTVRMRQYGEDAVVHRTSHRFNYGSQPFRLHMNQMVYLNNAHSWSLEWYASPMGSAVLKSEGSYSKSSLMLIHEGTILPS